MTLDEIRAMPTSIDAARWRVGDLSTASGAHESILRAYHILAKVKELVNKNTAPDVIQELIWFMESEPKK